MGVHIGTCPICSGRLLLGNVPCPSKHCVGGPTFCSVIRRTFPLPSGWPSPPTPPPRCGLPSPPAPLPHCGRGVNWLVDSVSLQDAGAGSLRLRSPPCSSALLVGTERGRGKVRAALTPDPAPALRAALTPGPSPALRERGELVSGLGIVERCWRRIATAMLTSPLFRSLGGSGRGGRGKVRGHPHPQPLSRAAGEGGAGSWTRYR